MQVPSHSDAFEVLCLQLADEGRGEALLGDSYARAREAARPFFSCKEFPDVYLEFPLAGAPFLDVTLLYHPEAPGMRIDSPAAQGTGPLLDWFAEMSAEYEGISFGFELDTKERVLPPVAVHFQPRRAKELVRPFCEVAGEPWRADLYLDLCKRLPSRWDLSYFGMFRGRPDSPLRVSGYLERLEKGICARNPSHLRKVFDAVGFTAYDEEMLAQVCRVMSIAPGSMDFQFDIYPDGTLGPVFSLDVQFEIAVTKLIRQSFANGDIARVMGQFEQWGAADERWHLCSDAAIARAIPVVLEDGTLGHFGFTLMPQWTKVRWTDGVLQPAKLYCLGNARLMEQKSAH